MKKVIIIAAAVVVVALLLLVVIGGGKKAEGKYVTAVIQKGDITVNVTATGSLEAVTTVQVGSQISGTISAINVDFNSQVKKGQVLAQIDPTFLKAQVEQAEADLQKSMASEKLAEAQYNRAKSLFDGNLIAAADRDAALATYQQAQADIKSSQANLERLRTNLNYATITSPIDGVVISRNIDVGQTVAASLQAPTLFTIAQDLTKMQVNTSIDEADIGKIKEGQTARFTVDAYPDRSFGGTVKQVRLAPTVVQNVVSYDVILEVSNPDMLLKPGMTANVTIEIERSDDVLKVPAAALRFRPANSRNSALSENRSQQNDFSRGANQSAGTDSSRSDSTAGRKRGGHPRLWILNSLGKLQPVPVDVGISDGTTTAVSSDSLKEGDTVIVGQEGAQAQASSQQVNPFVPRFGGGRR